MVVTSCRSISRLHQVPCNCSIVLNCKQQPQHFKSVKKNNLAFNLRFSYLQSIEIFNRFLDARQRIPI